MNWGTTPASRSPERPLSAQGRPEAGACPLMLMAKSRHRKTENVRRCLKPSPEVIAEVTGLLAPGDSRR